MPRALLIIALILTTTGCSMQHMQEQVDKLGAIYNTESNQISSAMGTRYYKISKEDAQSGVLLALTNLGISVENQDLKSGFVIGRSTLPRPLTQAEFEKAWATEAPRAKQVTGFDFFWPGTIDLISNILINERASDIQVNIRLRMKHTVVKEDWVLLTELPPEVMKLTYKKIWDEFEKTTFVQSKVISK